MHKNRYKIHEHEKSRRREKEQEEELLKENKPAGE